MVNTLNIFDGQRVMNMQILNW